MTFRDRREAGRKLGNALSDYRGRNAIVLALPRGGVPVGAEVALALDASLDVLLVRKIGVPWQPELAMGAVIDGAEPVIVRNEDIIELSGVSEDDFAAASRAQLKEIEHRRQRFTGNHARADVADRVAIIVDDGIATGATVRAAIRGLRRDKPDRIVLAVPVAPPSTVEELRDEVDDVVCLETPAAFRAISLYYREFNQVSDDEVARVLAGSGAGQAS